VGKVDLSVLCFDRLLRESITRVLNQTQDFKVVETSFRSANCARLLAI
jgi:hypothetical protein